MAEWREYEGDVHWYDLPDDEAEEYWVPDETDETVERRWAWGRLGVAR
ncbi:hypothetical protein ACU635_48795 [[Actinomadura] parvosata]